MYCRLYNKIKFSFKNVRLFSTNYSPNTHHEAEKNIVRSRIFNIQIPDLFIEEYIWQNLDKWHDKTAVVCSETGRSYLFSQVYQKSGAVSNFLRNKVPGVKENDVIAVVLPNVPEYAIILLGIIQAGLRVTTINPNYTAEEISNQFLHSDPKFVFTMNNMWPQVQQAIQKTQSTIPVAILKHQQSESLPRGAINFTEILEENHVISFPFNRSTSSVAIMPFSSGTTGSPKGVELTHKNIVSNLYQLNVPAFKMLRDTEGSFQEVVPLILPIFHLYGMVIVLLNAFLSGSRIITMPKFKPDSFIELIEMHHPTCAYLTPPLILFLINSTKVKPAHIIQLSTIVCSAAPLGASDVAKLKEKSNYMITLLQMYGLTEASPGLFVQTKHMENGIKIGGSGLVVPNTEFLLLPPEADHRTGLGPNTTGQIVIRGPQVMKGYYKNNKATEAAIAKDGWLNTGDIGYYDEDGHIFITDRLKELIKVKGFQVAPAELEEVLRNHPDIEDAAVVGIPHPKYGEVPKAFIVAKQNARINVPKIHEYVSSKVTDFKQLRGGIVIMGSIPKTSSGKILRRELKEF